jgi:hypothetical protein
MEGQGEGIILLMKYILNPGRKNILKNSGRVIYSIYSLRIKKARFFSSKTKV